MKKTILGLFVMISFCCKAQDSSLIIIGDLNQQDVFQLHSFGTFSVNDSLGNTCMEISDSGMVVTDSLCTIKILLEGYMKLQKQINELMKKEEQILRTYFKFI